MIPIEELKLPPHILPPAEAPLLMIPIEELKPELVDAFASPATPFDDTY